MCDNFVDCLIISKKIVFLQLILDFVINGARNSSSDIFPNQRGL